MAGTDGLDERFITSVDLSPYLFDKDTGVALANGAIKFYKDTDRTVPKAVYQLTGDPNNVGGYTYTALPNPVRLSAVGSIESIGNNVALYYFPYDGTQDDSTGAIELYYVVVENSLGVVQFTRAAWPNSIGSNNPLDDNGTQTNQISNPQFVDFSSYNENVVTINYTDTATNRAVNIAPDWQLIVDHSATTTVTVERIAIAGSSAFPTNPPYWLKITPGASLMNIKLVQTLPSNPALCMTTNDGIASYISGGLLLASNTSATLEYKPSAGNPTQFTIKNKTNTSDEPAYFSGTVQLPLSTNSQNANIGSMALVIKLSSVNASQLTSVQLVGSYSAEQNVPYIQQSVNRQNDYLFHYYKQALINKPIPSYLVGWDFPLNPAQFGGRLQGSSLSANQSKYVWDQTIMYQSAASGFSVNTATTDATSIGALELKCTAAAGGQFALVQYLTQDTAREVLSNLLSVQIDGNTSITAGLKLTVSLWYTTDVAAPLISSDLSIVGTLDVNGKPATFNGTWVEVPTADLQNKTGLLTNATGTGGNSLKFEYWNPLATDIPATTATFFAIVVGSELMAQNDLAAFKSISLVPGKIATAPAPQAKDEVLRECRNFYQKSYEALTAPGASTYYGVQFAIQEYNYTALAVNTASFQLNLKSSIRIMPTIKFYSPATGTVDMVSLQVQRISSRDVVGDYSIVTGWTPEQSTTNSTSRVYFVTTVTGVSTGATLGYGADIFYHYVADARIGVI